jgi:exonuclease I
MSDPKEIKELLGAAEDAFGHAEGRPEFEPELNASQDAESGEVQIQKACRLLDLARKIDEVGEYYGAVLEHSFIAVEHTFQGYLLAIAGADERELRDHTSPYELAKGQVPLEDETVEALSALYDARRTRHYYGTTVTTEQQAHTVRALATAVHEHVVGFDSEIERFCVCQTHRED